MFKGDCVHLGRVNKNILGVGEQVKEQNIPFCFKENMGPDGCPENCPFYNKSYI